VKRQLLRVVVRAAAVLATCALLIIGLLALTGGLRLRSPINEMQAKMDGFELERGERVENSFVVEDAICFLQCAEWTVHIEVRREMSQSLERECQDLMARLERWSGSDVRRVVPRYEPEGDCTLSVEHPVFGHENWRAVAGFDVERAAGPAGNVIWTLTLLAP
jgi:hypothetical protein